MTLTFFLQKDEKHAPAFPLHFIEITETEGQAQELLEFYLRQREDAVEAGKVLPFKFEDDILVRKGNSSDYGMSFVHRPPNALLDARGRGCHNLSGSCLNILNRADVEINNLRQFLGRP